jgi:hypothetical protein
LEKQKENEGWMSSYELYNELKLTSAYKNLEYYQLYNLNYKLINIERKPLPGKEEEIGYLRYSKQE